MTDGPSSREALASKNVLKKIGISSNWVLFCLNINQTLHSVMNLVNRIVSIIWITFAPCVKEWYHSCNNNNSVYVKVPFNPVIVAVISLADHLAYCACTSCAFMATIIGLRKISLIKIGQKHQQQYKYFSTENIYIFWCVNKCVLLKESSEMKMSHIFSPRKEILFTKNKNAKRLKDAHIVSTWKSLSTRENLGEHIREPNTLERDLKNFRNFKNLDSLMLH